MSVTSYNINTCNYYIGKLAKVVYLISEDASKDIIIDQGAAYISGITEEPLTIAVNSISVTDTDRLDERYQFTHDVSFTVDGYANHKDFEGRYYVIVRSEDGVYWLVNPMFPCKVTYTYTLDSQQSQTSFSLATVSNHPTLRVIGMNEGIPYKCGYQRCTFKSFKLNEKAYSTISRSGTIKYTNDGFKGVTFNKNSATFTETFDGNNISHKLDFSIHFDDYKSSWHYNLLEFIENKYSTIIQTSCGKQILCGFHFGLQPSFNIDANSEMEMDVIEISMSDLHDNGSFITVVDAVDEDQDPSKTWVYTSKYRGYECIGKNTAIYLLKEEVDAFNNPTGSYMCLEGYEERFPNLNIIGTFNERETFENANCGGEDCEVQSSIPNEVVFNLEQCRNYSLLCDGNWSISSSNQGITVSPSNGNANTPYTLSICNTITPTPTAVTATLTMTYCGSKTKTYNVRVVKGSGCFPSGQVYDISGSGQYVTIPIVCCVSRVDASVVSSIQIQNTYIKVYVPQNTTGVPRTIPLSVIYCDNSTSVVTINQGIEFERWIKEGTTCNGTMKCDVERRYTGLTPSDINTRTNETRLTNCILSTECSGTYTRWIDTEDTYCSNGRKYIVRKEQTSVNNVTWSDTGRFALGDETDDSPDGCSGLTYEYRWLLTDETTCAGTDKYLLYKQQRAVSGTSDWEDIIPTTKNYNGNGTMPPVLVESASTDCGYVAPSSALTEWRLVSGFICDDCEGGGGGTTTEYRWHTVSYNCQGYDRYAHQVRQQSTDGVTWVDVVPEQTQDILYAYNSSECGYVSPYTFTWGDSTTIKNATHDYTSGSMTFEVISTKNGGTHGWSVFSKTANITISEVTNNSITVTLPTIGDETNVTHRVRLKQDDSNKTIELVLLQYGHMIPDNAFKFEETDDATLRMTMRASGFNEIHAFIISTDDNGGLVPFTYSSDSDWFRVTSTTARPANKYYDVATTIGANSSLSARTSTITFTQNGTNNKLYIIVDQEGYRCATSQTICYNIENSAVTNSKVAASATTNTVTWDYSAITTTRNEFCEESTAVTDSGSDSYLVEFAENESTSSNVISGYIDLGHPLCDGTSSSIYYEFTQAGVIVYVFSLGYGELSDLEFPWDSTERKTISVYSYYRDGDELVHPLSFSLKGEEPEGYNVSTSNGVITIAPKDINSGSSGNYAELTFVQADSGKEFTITAYQAYEGQVPANKMRIEFVSSYPDIINVKRFRVRYGASTVWNYIDVYSGPIYPSSVSSTLITPPASRKQISVMYAELSDGSSHIVGIQSSGSGTPKFSFNTPYIGGGLTGTLTITP